MTTEIRLPPMPEWAKLDDLGGQVPSQIRTAKNDYAHAIVSLADKIVLGIDSGNGDTLVESSAGWLLRPVRSLREALQRRSWGRPQ